MSSVKMSRPSSGLWGAGVVVRKVGVERDVRRSYLQDDPQAELQYEVYVDRTQVLEGFRLFFFNEIAGRGSRE